MHQLQRGIGNQAVLSLLRSAAIHAKLAVGAANDPLEHEADRVADEVMRKPDPGLAASSAEPQIRRKCAACEEEEKTLRPKSAAGSEATAGEAPSIVQDVLRSPGDPLDPAARSFFEPRFGRSFDDVRVHTDAEAAASARSIQARAYAAGDHLVFDHGQFSPNSEQGQRLLAHELTHVTQHDEGASSAIRRDLDPSLSITMTPEYAHDLSDAELGREEAALSARLRELDDEATEDWLDGGPEFGVSPEWDAVAANLRILRDEKSRRAKGGGVQEVGQVPRPAGLPLEGGYQLQEAPEQYQRLAAQIPEGQLIDVVAMPHLAQGGGPQTTRYTSPLDAAGFAATTSVNASVMSRGFAAAGDNAIVIVAIPRAGTPGAMVPESLTLWGHTAVGARVDGELVTVRGLSPKSMFDVMGDYTGVRTGASAVPSTITNDIGLLKNTGALTLEYPVTREVADAFARGLPPPGPFSPAGPMYTAVPSAFGDTCAGQNCVLWATQQAEEALGGRIGPAGGAPIADVPQVGQGGQGQLIRFMRGAAQGAEDVGPVENAIGAPVAAGMSTGFKIVKVGGRVMFVVSLIAIPVETALAPEGERARTFAGASGGFLGGLAAGATAGLVCGPGALACSIVLGLGAGIVGALGGRAAAEGIFDFFDRQRMTPAEFINTSTLMFGTPEDIRKMCELRALENPDLEDYDPMCGKLY
jgi:hypothetical protein